MKKNHQKTGDQPRSVSRTELAWVRGGGIQGSGLAADNGVISIQKDNGVIHMQN